MLGKKLILDDETYVLKDLADVSVRKYFNISNSKESLSYSHKVNLKKKFSIKI